MLKKLKIAFDSLYTALYMAYNPWDVADVVREIQRNNKPRIKYTSDGEPYNTQENASKHFCFHRGKG
jgi:hypothetical protein